MAAVFVFGSNLAGRHGAGAAQAALTWGARYGEPTGRHGNTYAIPTKDRDLRTLPVHIIRGYVDVFIDYARTCPDDQFLVSAVGTGFAGIAPDVMAEMFTNAPGNVTLPHGWRDVQVLTSRHA